MTPATPTDAGMESQTDIIKKRRALGVYGIATFKLVKGIIVLLVAFGIFALSDNNLPEEFRTIIHWLNIKAEREIFTEFFKWLGTITESNMLWVAAGTFAYALLALAEAAGLFMRYTWGAWLAMGESGVFIPVEIYRLIQVHSGEHRISIRMLCLLILNVFFFVYLLRNRHRLFRKMHLHHDHH